jgi:hypothetical protein
MSQPVTEPQLVRHVLTRYCHFGRRGTAMPHYTPDGWWECDVAYFTTAGYLHEFEIKLSLSDFRADARKERQFTYRGPKQKKHAAAAAGNGPKLFYYVAPAGVIPQAELPGWAGLIEAEWRDRAYHREGTADTWLWSQIVVQPPVLGGRKFEQRQIDHCRGVAYYRYLNQCMRQK